MISDMQEKAAWRHPLFRTALCAASKGFAMLLRLATTDVLHACNSDHCAALVSTSMLCDAAEKRTTWKLCSCMTQQHTQQ